MRGLVTVGAMVILVACQTGMDDAQVRRDAPADSPLNAGASTGLTASLPDDACWARDTMPARLGTVYDTDPATGARVPRQVQVEPAQERLFAVPCPEQMDTRFVETLQRALAVRGYHTGPITGTFDSDTAQAIRLYQAPQGLDSAILSLQAAQQLGLIAVAVDPA